MQTKARKGLDQQGERVWFEPAKYQRFRNTSWDCMESCAGFFLIFLLKFDLIYLTHTFPSREVVAPGNSLPEISWKHEFHAVTWWRKQLSGKTARWWMLTLKHKFLGNGTRGLPTRLTAQPVGSGSGAGTRPNPWWSLPRPRQCLGMFKRQGHPAGVSSCPWVILECERAATGSSEGHQEPFTNQDKRESLHKAWLTAPSGK